MHRRKRNEAEYIILLFCALLATVLVPFTVLRVQSGEYAVAALDLALIVVMVWLFIYVYKTGDVKLSGYVTACVFVAGTVTTIYLKGGDQIHWAYPAFVVIFYFLRPETALLISCLSIFSIIPALQTEYTFLEMLKVLMTLLVNVACAFMFTKIMGNQRRELKRRSMKDPLTQVGNRSAMDIEITKVFDACISGHKSMCAMMVDVDHFKRINDSFGHQVGDKVIVRIAEFLEQKMLITRSVYRYGGEEFFVLLRDMNQEDARQFAESLRIEVENTTFCEEVRFTISIGISELQPDKSPRQWIEQADQALYQAKHSGRNCVVIFQEKDENTDVKVVNP